MSPSPTLFARLGGEKTVHESVEAMYEKVVVDELLKPFFKGVDFYHQQRKMAGYLRFAFGSGTDAAVPNLREMHAHMFAKGLDVQHFDALLGHLLDTMKEDLKLAPELIAEVNGVMQEYRPMFANHPPTA